MHWARIKIFTLTAIIGLLLGASYQAAQNTNSTAPYDEPYRPQFHFTPA